MENKINMEKEKVITLEELEGKHILQAFVAGSRVYLQMAGDIIYVLDEENLKLSNAASTTRVPEGAIITKVTIEKFEILNQFRVLIECNNYYKALVIYTIEDPSSIVCIRVKETKLKMVDFEVATLKYNAERVTEEFNETLIGANIKKVTKSNAFGSAILVTDNNLILIQKDYGMKSTINFDLQKIEGRTIEHVECAKVTINSVLLRVYVENLQIGSTEPLGTIEIINPDSKSFNLKIEERDLYRIDGDYDLTFSSLVGQTIISIEGSKGDDELIFTMDGGYKITMYHEQDCCESVYLEDICGNLDDLIGSPLLQAEEIINDNPDDKIDDEDNYESRTWTFYKLATAKGFVTLRWLGESNGYYSESVDISISPINNNEDDSDKKVYLQ